MEEIRFLVCWNTNRGDLRKNVWQTNLFETNRSNFHFLKQTVQLTSGQFGLSSDLSVDRQSAIWRMAIRSLAASFLFETMLQSAFTKHLVQHSLATIVTFPFIFSEVSSLASLSPQWPAHHRMRSGWLSYQQSESQPNHLIVTCCCGKRENVFNFDCLFFELPLQPSSFSPPLWKVS